MPEKTFNLIGLSRVALTLCPLFERAGYRLASVYNRTPEKALALRQTRPNLVLASPDQMPAADLYIIGVTDDLIETMAIALSTNHNISHGQIAIHFSGAHASDRLWSLKPNGLYLASTHPTYTFCNVESLAENHGLPVVIEGDDEARACLKPLYESMGFSPLLIEKDHKVLYHVMCVFASNYLFAYGEIFQKLGQSLGMAKPIELLTPLMEKSWNNYRTGGVSKLTGPIKRGDVGTLKKHIEALKDVPEPLPTIYKAFGSILKEALSSQK